MNTIPNDTKELQSYFCPYWSLDIGTVAYIGDKIWIDNDELFDILDDTRESFWCETFENINPVASVLEHALQMTRNHIEEITWYDFQNDNNLHSTEIYTYWNYMCSSYDYSSEAIERLKKHIYPYLLDLVNNKWCKYFLKELELG